MAICIALSAVGNLIAVVYTYSRVKQAIAVQNFLPFSTLLKQNKTYPIGGIILHWAITVATIIAIPNTADGYSFVVGLFPYGHTIIASACPIYKTSSNRCFWGLTVYSIHWFRILLDRFQRKRNGEAQVPWRLESGSRLVE